MGLTAQQRSARKGRITSTTMAAILGVHPWTTELEAWHEIRNPKKFPKPETAAMRIGTVLEPWCAEEYRRKRVHKPCRLVRSVGTIRSPKYPWLAASPDGLVIEGFELDAYNDDSDKVEASATGKDVRIALEEDDSDRDVPWPWTIRRVYEGKAHGFMSGNRYGVEYWIDAWADDGIPPYHQIQGDVMMLVTGAPCVDYSAVVPGEEHIIERRRRRDDDHLQNLVEVGMEWHDRHIVHGEEPKASGGDLELLQRLYPDAAEIEIYASDVRGLEDAAQQYAEMRRLRLIAAKKEEEYKARLQQFMGSASVAKGDDWKITWREAKGRKYIDEALLEQLAPGVLEQVTRRTPSRRFNPTGDAFKALTLVERFADLFAGGDE